MYGCRRRWNLFGQRAQRLRTDFISLCELQLALTEVLDFPIMWITKLDGQCTLPPVSEDHIAEV